jgi:hypothetical protein
MSTFGLIGVSTAVENDIGDSATQAFHDYRQYCPLVGRKASKSMRIRQIRQNGAGQMPIWPWTS